MLKAHKELVAQIDGAIATARQIEVDGGNAQAILNTLREAKTLAVLRVANYEDAAKPETKPK